MPKTNVAPASTAARNLTKRPATHAKAAFGQPNGAKVSARSSPFEEEDGEDELQPEPRQHGPPAHAAAVRGEQERDGNDADEPKQAATEGDDVHKGVGGRAAVGARG